MNSLAKVFTSSVLLSIAIASASCKKEEKNLRSAVDLDVAFREIERLNIVQDAVLFPLDPVSRITKKEERAQKIAQLRTLLKEESQKELEAYKERLKNLSPESLIKEPIPPIKFPKPSGHAYLPELTNLEVEQLKKLTQKLEKFFEAEGNSTGFLYALRKCEKVVNEVPGLERELK